MGFREPAYTVLSAVLGFVTLILGMTAVFFVFAAIRGALSQTAPHVPARLNAIVIWVIVATVCGLMAFGCGRLTYKCLRAANRE